MSFDAAVLDGPLPDSAGSPVATFELIMDGVVQNPESCGAENWDFTGDGQSSPSVYIRNASSVTLAYTAAPVWYVGGVPYTPGLKNPAGPDPQDVGTLEPGDYVDISAFYAGGYTALLGSSKPFSIADGGYPPHDEGTIAWPSSVPDDVDAGTMYVAEIYVGSGCPNPTPVWK